MSSDFNRLHRARFSKRRTIRAAAKEAWDVQERRIDALKAEIKELNAHLHPKCAGTERQDA
jgi:hypothetical protein